MHKIHDYQKQLVTKKGRRVLLRIPTRGDVSELLRYINALVEEDTFISVDKKVTRKEEEKYVSERLKAAREKTGFTILVEYRGRIIANGQVNRKAGRLSHVGELGISVAKKYRNEGLGTQLMGELLRLSKDFLHARLVYLYVFSNNALARSFYKKVGFRESGEIPRAIFHRGTYVDQVFMYLDL